MPFVSLEFILLGVRRIDSIAPKKKNMYTYTCIYLRVCTHFLHSYKDPFAKESALDQAGTPT